MVDNCLRLLEAFLKSSFSTVKVLVEGVNASKDVNINRKVNLFRFVDGRKISFLFDDRHFFLRGSVEYTNPQLTVEEVQGVIGTRLLESCANYYCEHGLREPNYEDILAIAEVLKKPPAGYIIPFLLNTDDVEPDRYSMNPLKRSLIETGQSAFPAANVRTENLKVDDAYAKKYDGSLISKKEVNLLNENLQTSKGSYLDFVDSVKYSQLRELSMFFDIDLMLYSLRMPLSTLQTENKDGLLHHIISESNRDYSSIEEAYGCMGRSMSKRTTLLTIPHSKKGFGSKRAARGKLHFEDGRLMDVSVKYKKTLLYPNAMDPEDIAVAECNDTFEVSGEKLSDYSFVDTPSSPQFFLYSMGSPEDAAVWHGVGAFAAPQLLQSYSSARIACSKGRLITNLKERYNIKLGVPLQFNLAPECMWSHPIHRNIDASIGSIEDLPDLVNRGMQLEYLSNFKSE